MALLHRRKAFSFISRFRLCGRSNLSSSASGRAHSKPDILGFSSAASSLSPQIQSMPDLQPAVAMHSSLWPCPRRCVTPATYLAVQQSTPCWHSLRLTSDCGCACVGIPHAFSRNCTTTAYPPPAPPREFEGGDQEVEADGAPLNVDDPEGMAGMDRPEDSNMPPYDDDANYPEDEEEYEDEDPPPDPEEKLLYSPSDEN